MTARPKEPEIESVIQAPNQRPIIKTYSASSSSEDIEEGTIRGIEETGHQGSLFSRLPSDFSN